MNCAQCQEQLVAHVEGLLGQPEQDHLESHLDDCPVCRAELDRTRELFDRLLRTGGAAPNVSWEAWDMDRMIRKQTLKPRRSEIMKRIAKIAVSTAALLCIGVGITYVMKGHDGQSALAQACEQIENPLSAAV